MSEHPTAVPLSKLSIDPVNVRHGADPKFSDAFAASIRHKGLLQPLLVRPDGNGKGRYLIIDGGMRFSALQRLLEEKAIKHDYMVPVSVREQTDTEARDTSLTTAVIHQPLHPVDKFEAFARLRSDGLSVPEIARRYGTVDREVEKSLALGALAPEVRKAWRAGDIDAERAKIFTLEPDHQRQAKVLGQLKKSGQIRNDYLVREKIIGDRNSGGAFLNYVTPAVYEAAGGKIHRDLFGTDDTVEDPALLKRLADEKLQKKCESLLADGWAWVSSASELPSNARYMWGRLHTPKGQYTADQKATRGAIIELNDNGTLDIAYGMEKPGAAKSGKGKAEKSKPKTTAGVISNLLMQRMSEWLTRAAQAALPTDIDLALAALCAGFGADKVVKVDQRGHIGSGKASAPLTKGNFGKLLAQFSRQTRDQNLAHLAKVAGIAVDMVVNHAGSPPLKKTETAALCAAIPAKVMNEELRKAFDARNYFDSVSRALALEAITEAVNADEARRLQGKTKGEVAGFAVTNVPKTGWLPKEMRTANYDGPGRQKKPAKAAKPKKPTRKAATAKKAKV